MQCYYIDLSAFFTSCVKYLHGSLAIRPKGLADANHARDVADLKTNDSTESGRRNVIEMLVSKI